MENTFEVLDSQNTLSDLRLWILKITLALYGILSLPIYFLIQQPWKIWKEKRIVWAKHKIEGDPYSPIERVVRNYDTSLESISTVDELFWKAVIKYGVKDCLGTRKILAEVEDYDKAGKIFRKRQLGNYYWMSYADAAKRVEALSKGFLSLGLKPKQTIIIFAETRREWMLVWQACLKNNIPVATLYATLGEEGIIHGINETKVSTIVTSQDLLPKLTKIIDKLPDVNKIIYMQDIKLINITGFPPNISVNALSEIERLGENYENATEVQSPCSDDIAVIIYTSGSTGIPKGVPITHRNILQTLKGMVDIVPEWNDTNVAIVYLPLAHIYEVMMECLYLHNGIQIGYSSPFTLTDNSTGLMSGCKGDISVLQPTIVCSVPLILDRIRKGVDAVISTKGLFARNFFNYAVEYKTFWWEKGFNCPILNRLIFRKVQRLLGGQVKYIVCGSAHLSFDTQIFVRACLDVKLLQAYGMTESTVCGAAMTSKDFSTGRVGAPLSMCYIKLVDWDEGGYRPTDKPHPRGEIILGGQCITPGYYKNEKLTEESYKDEDGKRWFYTGDIGEIFPDGTLKIIDRKKDLQKLQRGEYVSLGKIEADMKTSPLVDNICVVGSKVHDYLVALVIPNVQEIRKLATALCKNQLTLRELCQDQELLKSFTDLFNAHGKKCSLFRHEIPQKVVLCSEEWLPETGFVTAALKIRRKQLEKFYSNAIDTMFGKSTAEK